MSRVEFTGRQVKSIVSAYTRKKNPASSNQLAEEYGVTPAIIRRVLREEGVKMRGPGRYVTA